MKEANRTWAFTGLELLKQKVKKLLCLVDPILQTRRFALVVGESDVGKTSFVFQLACAVASAQSHFLGYELHAKHRRAILVVTEDDENSMAHHLRQMDRAEQWADNLFILVADGKSVVEIRMEIEEITSSTPVDIVIFDCLGDLYNGRDSNDFSAVRDWYKDFVALSHECLVLFTHHKGKNATGHAPHKNQALGS